MCKLGHIQEFSLKNQCGSDTYPYCLYVYENQGYSQHVAETCRNMGIWVSLVTVDAWEIYMGFILFVSFVSFILKRTQVM